jgi:endonuclease YncB( thermonuclease family)
MSRSPERTGPAATLRGTLTPARIGIALAVLAALVSAALFARPAGSVPATAVYRIDHVADGDTVDLGNGARVRLVQIDTPEVYFGTECYGPQASAITKRLLPPGTAVRLLAEPATDRVDEYGRLLRYVVRVRDGLNVNVHLVAIGAAAPYFYDGRRGMFAARLEQLARRARAERLGLWGACPRTPLDPDRGVATRR